MWIRTDLALVLPPEIRETILKLNSKGYEAYVVGGAVRDAFLQVPCGDFDIATSASFDELAAVFPQLQKIGAAFGVGLLTFSSGFQIEIATFRKEDGILDHRHPATVTHGTLQDDAGRRDFTINALYYDLKQGRVFDAHQGCVDLQKKIIRTVGDPRIRFKEDALRLLRAVRFAARFGFELDPDLVHSAREQGRLLKKISQERIRDELGRMLIHGSRTRALVLLDHLHLIPYVFPEIENARREDRKVWERTLRAIDAVRESAHQFGFAEWVAVLLSPLIRTHPLEDRERQLRIVLKHHKIPVEPTERIVFYVLESPKFRSVFGMRDAKILRWVQHPHFLRLAEVHRVEAVATDGNLAGYEFALSLMHQFRNQPVVTPLLTGDDLIGLGFQPGPKFSAILDEVHDLFLEKKLETKEQAMSWVIDRWGEAL